MDLRANRPIWRPYTQEKIAAAPIELARAEGAHLYTRDGRKIFDGISSWWLITHGHCHPEIAEAVSRQAERLDQVVFANFSHEPGEELAERLLRMTSPDLTRVFFSDNGSTAVEVALKMAWQACAQRGQTRRTKFLAFREAYHGDTVGAMSVSAKGSFTQPYQNLTFEILRARQPTLADTPAAEWTRDFKLLLEKHHTELAAVILEPLVQGAAGMIVWPDEAVGEIAMLCREYGVYLIFDEVMTGFGRTGSLFAMHRLGVTPDLLCLSKGLTGGMLPLSVTLARESIFEAFWSDEKARMLFHGHSFTGNPVSCAAAVANLKIFERENTVARLHEITSTHSENLERLARRMPIQNMRVCGTIAAFDFPAFGTSYTRSNSDALSSRFLLQGLFLRTLGQTVYLLPPLCAQKADLQSAWDVIAEVVSNPV